MIIFIIRYILLMNVTSLNVLFCLINRPKAKDIQFTVWNQVMFGIFAQINQLLHQQLIYCCSFKMTISVVWTKQDFYTDFKMRIMLLKQSQSTSGQFSFHNKSQDW